MALILSQNTAAALVPAALVSSTIESAILFAAGKAAAGLVSTSVAALTEGALHAMFLTKVKIATAALLTLAVLGTGGSIVSYRTLAGQPGRTTSPASFSAEERKLAEQRGERPNSAEGERRRDDRGAPAFRGGSPPSLRTARR